MRWQTSSAFFLGILPILVLLWRAAKPRSFKGSLKFSTLELFGSMSRGIRANLAGLPFFLKTLALLLAIVALARPQMPNSKINKNVEGIDAMITLDISDSMEIEDMEPLNRISAAKQVIQKFIKGRSSDRIGLIVFSGESFTRVPLTLDYDILSESVSSISTQENLKQGTAIGVALANAVARLKDSAARSRIIILLTDGDNNSGVIHPDQGLEIAKGFGIKVYTIAVGVTGQTRLPVIMTDAFGNKIKRYQPFYSRVDDDLLNKIATETGGKYYRADSTDTLKQVFSDIDRLEKSKVEVNRYVKYSELFSTYLLWALMIYALQFVLSYTLLRRAT